MASVRPTAPLTRRGGGALVRARSLGLTRRLAVDLGRTSTATCRRGRS